MTDSSKVQLTLEEYNAYFGTNLNATQFAELSNDAKTKIPAVIAANEITTSSKPYLVITYTIQDGTNTPEEFTAYFNLAAAFGMDGTNENSVDKTKFAFNEGWQNTLHITLSPDAIEFCAQVAEWSTVEEELVVE